MNGHGRARRILVAWGAGLATTLAGTFAAIIAAPAIAFERDADHAGWLGLFVGFPVAAVVGGYLAARMAGSPALPAGAWVVLNPAIAVCAAILLFQASQSGLGSGYFVEVVGPSTLVVALSFGGALWGRKRWLAPAVRSAGEPRGR
jgi:hypothetical protein